MTSMTIAEELGFPEGFPIFGVVTAAGAGAIGASVIVGFSTILTGLTLTSVSVGVVFIAGVLK